MTFLFKNHIKFIALLFVFYACDSTETSNKNIEKTEELEPIEINLTQIKPPLETTIPFQKVELSAEKDTLLVLSDGSFIDIPENAFLDEVGNPINGKVDFSYRTFNNPVDFLVSGIPMALNIDDEGVDILESAGMIEVSASQNGKELKPNPEAKINVGFASTQEEEYPLYKYTEGQGWSRIGETEYIDQNKIDSITKSTVPDLPRVIKKDFSLYEITDGLIEDKPNLKKYRGMLFQPANKKDNMPLPTFLKDMDIKTLGGGKYMFILTEHNRSIAPHKIVCNRVYNFNEYEKKYQVYMKKYGKYIRLRMAIEKTQKLMKQKGNTVFHAVKLEGFGILNCDQADRIDYKNLTYSIDGKKRVNIVLYCVDYTRNTKYPCSRVDRIGIVAKNRFAIFGVTHTNEIVYSPISKCKNALKGNNFDFKMTKLQSDMPIEKLKELLEQ